MFLFFFCSGDGVGAARTVGGAFYLYTRKTEIRSLNFFFSCTDDGVGAGRAVGGDFSRRGRGEGKRSGRGGGEYDVGAAQQAPRRQQ